MTLYRKKKTPTGKEPVRAERNERRDSECLTKNQQDYCSTSDLVGQLILKIQEVNSSFYDHNRDTLFPFVKFEISFGGYETTVFYQQMNDCESIESERMEPLNDDVLRRMIDKVTEVGELRRKLYG